MLRGHLRLHANVHEHIHKRAAPDLKYWQLRRSEFYIANSITIIAAICAQRGAASPPSPPLEKGRP
jgi:hypothetical protein